MGWSQRTLRAAAGVAALAGIAYAAESSPGRERPDPRAEARVELGRRLFFDPAASAFGKTSCASCHDPAHGFSDPRVRSQDETQLTPRHSQGLLDLSEAPGGFHWDGEFGTLTELVTARLGTPEEIQAGAVRRLADHLEAAVRDDAAVDGVRLSREFPRALTASGPYGSAVTPSGRRGPVTRLRGPVTPSSSGARTVARRLVRDGLYAGLVERAFGDERLDTPRIAAALEAYVLSLRSTESRFDRYMQGDERALGPAAKRGFELFAGKAGCATCHTVPVPGKGRAFSDFSFRNTGVAYMRRGQRDETDRSRSRRDGADAGRGRVTVRVDDEGRFKTANLRDVALRAPYMHDGRFESLEEVVRYYDAGGTPNDHLDPAIRKLDLTEGEVRDLVAFLESLSGEERPGLGPLPEHRSDRVRLRIVDLDGRPLRGFPLLVRPAGDHFRGTDGLPEPFEVETDRRGYASFPFPASTHVALDAFGYELGEGRLLPDSAKDLTLIATPLDTVSVIVRKGGDLKRLPSELFVTPIDGTPARAPAGPSATFRRERTLGDGRVLYTASLSDLRQFHDCRTARLGVTTDGTLGEFDFDASGGATEAIDLRDPEEARETVGALVQDTRRLITAFREIRKDTSGASRGPDDGPPPPPR